MSPYLFDMWQYLVGVACRLYIMTIPHFKANNMSDTDWH